MMFWNLMMLNTGFAADYVFQTDVAVNLNPPPSTEGEMELVKLVIEILDPANLPDQVVQSTWGPLSCRVKDNWVTVRVKGDHSTWPTTLPTSGEAVCTTTYNGKSYELTVNLTQDVDVNWGDGFNDFTVGYVMAAGAGHTRLAWTYLPTGYTYVEEVTKAFVSPGVTTDHVACEVEDRGSGYFAHMVRIEDTAPTDNYFCMVWEDGNPVPHMVPLAFTRQ